MEQCWRWYGPKDPVKLADIAQAGATGIVSALHDNAPGVLWPLEEIEQHRDRIAAAGLRWSVVESLPVSDAIKAGTAQTDAHIQTWIASMRNLAQAGVTTICYNFMPVLDWTRTQLRRPQADGALAMHFDLIDFAAFDIHILRRRNADRDFPAKVVAAAADRFAGMSPDERNTLSANCIAGLPGAASFHTPETLQAELDHFADVSADHLRSNLKRFLQSVVPVAEKLGVRLCCHPDDPPFALLGLPRIVSTHTDLRSLVDAVPSPANGITFCSGSLGASGENDLSAIFADLAPDIHFVHFRSVSRSGEWGKLTSFTESAHLDGDCDLTGLMQQLVAEEKRRLREGRDDHRLPVRPDHGQEITTDLGRNQQPGYPLIGRLRGLAELRGLEAAFKRLATSD